MRRVLLSAGIGLTLCASLAIPAGAARGDEAPIRTVVAEPAADPIVQERRPTAIDAISLECASRADVLGARCAWRPTNADDAVGYQLWRIVDRGERELVWRGGLDHTSASDRIPAGTKVVRYAVLALDADGEIVGQSRPVTLRLRDHDRDEDRTPVRRVVASSLTYR